MGKILAIIAVGMPASLVFTAQIAVSIRKMVKTELEDSPTPKKLPPFKRFHYSLWGTFHIPSFAKWAQQLPSMDMALTQPFLNARHHLISSFEREAPHSRT